MFSDDGKRIPLQGVQDIQISREEVETIFLYIQSWTQRQCSCCFRDSRNFERFNWAIQIFIIVVIEILKHYPDEESRVSVGDDNSKKNNKDSSGVVKDKDHQTSSTTSEELEVKVDTNDDEDDGEVVEKPQAGDIADTTIKTKAVWQVEDKDKLIHFVSKVFLNSFPTYVAYKQHMQVKNDEITPQEIQALSQYCEINEPEASPYLFRNVSLFCKV